MTRRDFVAAFALAPLPALRVAAFRADATPPLGEPLIWVDPAKEVLDPLWAKGIVLDNGSQRVVLCAVDWCGLGGATHALFRQRIADAAGTSITRVAVQVVHQHTAPYIEGDGAALLAARPDAPLMMSAKALDAITGRIADAVAKAVKSLEPFDRVGLGHANVEQVASARRIVRDGILTTRFSSGGRDPELAALPEGAIDRTLRTVTLARGSKPLVRLHYYATHPQTFCCDGRVSADFVGAAREAFEKTDGVPQIYFTGCAGDVTVGKYNDTTKAAYSALEQRLTAAFQAASVSTRYSPASGLAWQTRPLTLPPRSETLTGSTGPERYRAAISEAFAKRLIPLEVSAVDLGTVRILNLPGEPMLEFQRYAQQVAGNRAVLVAGYGDISPGYLCTDEAFRQGGYEPGASNAGIGTEARVKAVIRQLIGPARAL